ncbi:hypothetical protein NFI96_028187, partial [Prochilodus magdalenae]
EACLSTSDHINSKLVVLKTESVSFPEPLFLLYLSMAHQYDIITERLENEYYPDNEIKHLRQENAHLKSEISKLSTQLRDSQNELHNFRERMGKVVDLKLGSSGVLSEDLTNPCRESELKRMYEKLSKNQWAKLLRQLKTGGPEMTTKKIKEERKKAEAVIKDVLRKSQDDIQNITGTMLCLTPSSQDHTSNSKTTKYFDMAVQNLQIAIFKEKKELYSRAKLQGVPEVLLPMIDDCYKTGCLMALHNPPLLLDWDSCGQGPFPPIKTGKFIPAKDRYKDTDDLRKGKFLPVTERDTDADTPRKMTSFLVKSVPVKERDNDTDILQKGSATQPGVWIPKRNQEKDFTAKAEERTVRTRKHRYSIPVHLEGVVQGNFLPVTERDKNADTPRKVKSASVKERDEEEVPRVQPEAKMPLPAARQSGSATQPGVWIPKRNQEKVKPGPQREREQSVNTFKMRLCPVFADEFTDLSQHLKHGHHVSHPTKLKLLLSLASGRFKGTLESPICNKKLSRLDMHLSAVHKLLGPELDNVMNQAKKECILDRLAELRRTAPVPAMATDLDTCRSVPTTNNEPPTPAQLSPSVSVRQPKTFKSSRPHSDLSPKGKTTQNHLEAKNHLSQHVTACVMMSPLPTGTGSFRHTGDGARAVRHTCSLTPREPLQVAEAGQASPQKVVKLPTCHCPQSGSQPRAWVGTRALDTKSESQPGARLPASPS